MAVLEGWSAVELPNGGLRSRADVPGRAGGTVVVEDGAVACLAEVGDFPSQEIRSEGALLDSGTGISGLRGAAARSCGCRRRRADCAAAPAVDSLIGVLKPFANEPILELRRAPVRARLDEAIREHDAARR